MDAVIQLLVTPNFSGKSGPPTFEYRLNPGKIMARAIGKRVFIFGFNTNIFLQITPSISTTK